MENRKELLEQYMEDGKLPLKGELFARKSVVGGKLEEFREEKRADALTSRPNAAGRQKLIVLRSSRIYWRVADRKSTRLNSSHKTETRMPSSA